MEPYIFINYNENLDISRDIISSYIPGKKVRIDKAIKFVVKDLINLSYENFEYVGETIERISSSLLMEYKFDIVKRNFYSYIMREMMRNVVEHSDSEELLLLIYNNDDEFGIKVIDKGIGIKKSLNSNPNYRVADDKTAIAFAIRPGITRSWKRDPNRDDVWQNSGFGLYMVSNIINKIGGRFELISGNSGLIFRNGFVEYANCKYKGTEVTVVFNKNIKVDTYKTIQEVSKSGSEYLKKSQNVFAQYAEVETASKASTLIK